MVAYNVTAKELKMSIVITAKHVNLSRSSKDVIAEYLDHMKRYFRRVYSIRLTLEGAAIEIRTSLQVHARSGDYRTTVTGSTIRDVMINACENIERQRRRRKRMVRRSRRHESEFSAIGDELSPNTMPDLSPDDFGV
jgi:ribosomal subunit interface protein